MDSLITAAARALAAGDPLGALTRVALRHDAPALALRGIAMAQLGDLVRAKALLRRAARVSARAKPSRAQGASSLKRRLRWRRAISRGRSGGSRPHGRRSNGMAIGRTLRRPGTCRFGISC